MLVKIKKIIIKINWPILRLLNIDKINEANWNIQKLYIATNKSN